MMNFVRKFSICGLQVQGQMNSTTCKIASSNIGSQKIMHSYLHRQWINTLKQSRFFSSSANRNIRKSSTNYYDILDVPVKATQKQIKDSYYSLSKKFHPDVNSSPEAIAKFQEISQAYEVLGTPSTRRMYDRGIYNPEYARRKREYTDHSESQFHQEKVFKKRQAAPTGRTEHYNYDEYYKMHYSEYKRRRDSARAAAAYQKQLRLLREENRGMNSVFEFCVIVSVVSILFYLIVG